MDDDTCYSYGLVVHSNGSSDSLSFHMRAINTTATNLTSSLYCGNSVLPGNAAETDMPNPDPTTTSTTTTTTTTTSTTYTGTTTEATTTTADPGATTVDPNSCPYGECSCPGAAAIGESVSE
eukprot:GHVU01083558.1.p1 GENE.GHVU01083558.1~~GHVU01083558.1.p1  ORF type:complete len:133 (-),score=19.10 GHVU01083558.1:637-1002(-)